MPTINLRGMDVDALLALRAEIDKRLGQKRSELEQQQDRRVRHQQVGGRAEGASGEEIPPQTQMSSCQNARFDADAACPGNVVAPARLVQMNR
jgi:hypothetical protein